MIVIMKVIVCFYFECHPHWFPFPLYLNNTNLHVIFWRHKGRKSVLRTHVAKFCAFGRKKTPKRLARQFATIHRDFLFYLLQSYVNLKDNGNYLDI